MVEDHFSHSPSLICQTQAGWCERPAEEELHVALHSSQQAG